MVHENDYDKSPPDPPNLGLFDFDICGVPELILDYLNDSELTDDDGDPLYLPTDIPPAIDVYLEGVKSGLTDKLYDYEINGDYELGGLVIETDLCVWGVMHGRFESMLDLIRTTSREAADTRLMDDVEAEALGEATTYLLNCIGRK